MVFTRYLFRDVPTLVAPNVMAIRITRNMLARRLIRKDVARLVRNSNKVRGGTGILAAACEGKGAPHHMQETWVCGRLFLADEHERDVKNAVEKGVGG